MLDYREDDERLSIHETSRFKRFMNGKGYYIALTVALVSVLAAGALTFGERLFVKAPTESEPSEVYQVEQLVTGQPDDRKTTTTTTTTATATTTTTAPSMADLYVLPFGNMVNKAYSDGQPAYSLTMGDWRTHNGADFAGKQGDAVKCIADGKVTEITDSPLWGGVVTVDHGMGVVSRYCGVNPSVKAGAAVKVGQTLGVLTSIPCEALEESHLHLEMTVDGKTVNPVSAIGLEVRYAQDTATTTTK